jgi:formylglycine-generating enzyme required for sulfatase activity
MSIRRFAAALGVSHRMVSIWEAKGDEIHPHPGRQADLDTMFATSSTEEKERFLTSLRAPDLVTPHTDLILPSVPNEVVAHPVDGKLMARVEAGVFLSGLREKPIWLDEYWIDVFPTTNADYERFVRATGHRAPKHWAGGTCPENLANHPVVHVTWRDACAYAAWAGKDLPSSQQWEKAARGSAGNPYPWGRQETFAKCNVRESGQGSTTPVDCYRSGVSPYGVYDLCGNTWEWCSTPTTSGRYELKGAAFTSPFERCAPASFNDACGDTMMDDDTSFRCATATRPT